MRFSKILGLFLVLITGCLFFASTGSALVPDRTLTVGTTSGTTDDNVTVPIALDNNTDVAGAAFTIGYDPAFLQFLGLQQATQVIDDGSNSTGTTHNFATSMFYQVNDKVNPTGGKIGRVMVAAASAQGFSSTTLFNARFKILGASGISHVVLIPSAIQNPQAGYPTSTTIPVLVGLPATTANTAGFYPTPTYATALRGGTVSVTAPGFTISGAVTYGASGPAANGSTVTLRRMAATGGYFYESQTTVSNGSYSFSNKPTGNYRLMVQPYDPVYFIANADINNLTANSTNDFTLETATPKSGTVQVNGAPLAGVRVRVTDDTGQVMGVFPTNDQGYFETMPLPPSGTYSYTAIYGSAEWPITAGATSNNTTLTLYTISGTPTPASATTVPVTVQVASANAKMIRNATINTDKTAGVSYTITNLVGANDYIVSAVTSGSPVLYYNQQTDIMSANPVDILSANATAVDFNFVPLDQSTISGHILNSATPVGVIAFNTTTFAIASDFSSSVDGNYTMTVEPGTYQLYAISNGKVFFYSTTGTTHNPLDATLITLANGETGGGDIDVSEDSCSINGSVTYSDGAPLQGALVFAGNSASGRAASITLQDGTYSITGIGVGTYQVGMDPMLANYSLQFQSITVDSNNCSTASADFIIDLGNTVSGSIREDASIGGLPIANAMLYMIDEGTGQLAGGRMYFGDDNGTYSIGDVPGSVYTMVVNHPAYQESRTSGLNIFTDTTQDVTMNKGAFISGTVSAGDGTAISDVTVVAISAGSTPAYARTDSSGAYAIYGLDANKQYLLIATKRTYQRQFSTLTTPLTTGATVNFTLTSLPSPFTLSGRVADDCTTPAPTTNARLIASFSPGAGRPDFVKGAITDDNGTYTISGLPQASGYSFTMVPPGNLPVQRVSGLDETSATTVTQDFTVPCPTSTGNEISGTITLTTPATTIYVVLYDATDQVVDYRVLANSRTNYSFSGLDSTKTFKVLAVAEGNTATWYDTQTTMGTANAITPGTTTANITLP